MFSDEGYTTLFRIGRMPVRLHWSFPDPSKAPGSEADQLIAARFQGKPVKRLPRNSSATSQMSASSGGAANGCGTYFRSL